MYAIWPVQYACCVSTKVPQILMSIHPQTGPTFASAYLDDILIFSESFDDYLHHLHQIIQCFADTGIKPHHMPKH